MTSSSLNPEPRGYSRRNTGLNPRRRKRRPAVTIIEVLFAILVATVGVFSVIVIFPFASAQAKRARINDMLAAAGRAAFHDFDARGMRIPDRLVAWDQRTPAAGVWASLNELSTINQPDFDWNTLTPANLQKNEALCIDPRFIAAQSLASGGLPPNCRTFPYQEPFIDTNGDGIWQNGENYTDLNNNGVHDPFQNPLTYSTNKFTVGGVPNYRQFDTSLMRRVTLRSSRGSAVPMGWQQADSVFVIDDDFAYQRDDKDHSKAATQDIVMVPSTGAVAQSPTQWFKRDSEGKISWIATLVPQLNVSGVQSDQYVLSVVMIYERTEVAVPGQQPAGSLAVDKFNERVVTGFALSDGTTGGEFKLVGSDPDQLKLRSNSWVMLSGVLPAPNSKIGRFQWYRITECDPEPAFNTATGNYELFCSLVGQDWNLSLSAPSQYTNPPYTPVRVTIVQGAFAVYEKSIRLEPDSTF